MWAGISVAPNLQTEDGRMASVKKVVIHDLANQKEPLITSTFDSLFKKCGMLLCRYVAESWRSDIRSWRNRVLADRLPLHDSFVVDIGQFVKINIWQFLPIDKTQLRINTTNYCRSGAKVLHHVGNVWRDGVCRDGWGVQLLCIGDIRCQNWHRSNNGGVGSNLGSIGRDRTDSKGFLHVPSLLFSHSKKPIRGGPERVRERCDSDGGQHDKKLLMRLYELFNIGDERERKAMGALMLMLGFFCLLGFLVDRHRRKIEGIYAVQGHDESDAGKDK